MPMASDLKEKFDVDIYCDAVDVYYHCFEDNSGASELAKLPKMRPHTEHMNNCYHHCKEYARRGEIKIHAAELVDQAFQDGDGYVAQP